VSTFFPARGTIYRVGGSGTGLYRVQGLAHPNILLTGVPSGGQDLIFRNHTLNGKRIIYSLGPGFGESAITGELLLGPNNGCGSSNLLSTLVSWWERNRVSTKRGPVSVSAGNRAFKLYVTSLVLAQPDPELNIQGFALQGTTAEPAST
jgi:hypothetical protein